MDLISRLDDMSEYVNKEGLEHYTELLGKKIQSISPEPESLESIDNLFSEYQAGDILLYDFWNMKKKLVSIEDWSIEKYPEKQYCPIGVVVVPKSHNIYNNAKYGIMSLVDMDANHPDIGGLNPAKMQWGDNNYDQRLVKQYLTLSYASRDQTILDHPWGYTSNTIYMSSDYLLTSDREIILNPFDIGTAYIKDYYYGLSPYPNSTAYIEQYRNETLSGKKNTELILRSNTGLPTWKVDATLPTNRADNYYPVFSCVHRFGTSGIDQGDWYLPTIMELGYVAARYKTIDTTLTKLKEAYTDSEISPLVNSRTLWSSTPQTSTKTWILNLIDITFVPTVNYDVAGVRAFTQF